MTQRFMFDLSDVIALLLDAQRHALRGDRKGADRIVASATELLKTVRPLE